MKTSVVTGYLRQQLLSHLIKMVTVQYLIPFLEQAWNEHLTQMKICIILRVRNALILTILFYLKNKLSKNTFIQGKK